jgi:hypothetical protein
MVLQHLYLALCESETEISLTYTIQGDSRSFTPAYGTYSWGYFLQKFLINLWSIFNSYGVTIDFRNAAL